MNYYDKKRDKRSKTYEELIYNEPTQEERKVQNVNISTKDGWILVFTAFRVFLPQILLFIIPLLIISLLLMYFFPTTDEQMMMNMVLTLVS
ncbi:hypothetical protein HYG86_13370 [Alkalicella caledoniensis]|uniref:Uncharacterized protein n=1 Tax=Alkalicella caledoniensis TaxID=2731377 RepID=A0A7G9WAI4_ALKCA|nr:hypothetical protein [Alkalicella caledoniensis]QNO15696.1 hypothetical protein HYG86_13370 [Alkalicella caledoniensis]